METSNEEYEKIPQDITSMAEALINAFQDENFVKENSRLLARLCDGEPVNKNPLTETIEPQMRLYGFSGVFISKYFDTEKELEEWMNNNDTSFGTSCIIEYLGSVANRSDVIRVTDKTSRKLYTAVDEDGYGIYNEKRSAYRGEFVWEYNHGNISDMYEAFRNRGIVFENDIYKKKEEKNEYILKYCRDNNLFNMGKK